jgi:hypothetical protein
VVEAGQEAVQEGRIVRLAQQVEAVGHVQLVATRGVFGHARQPVVVADFADHGSVGILVEQGAQALQEGQVLRPALVVDVALPAVGVEGIDRRVGVAAVGCTPARVVAQLRVVEEEIDRVQPVAVHAQVEPELHGRQQRVLHLRVVEVQVGLAGQEVVQVILAAARVPLPGAAAEDGEPVVGWVAVVPGVGPDVPVGLGVVAAAAALDEPGVLVAAVREHLVDHDLQAQFVRAGDEGAEVFQRAEHRIDVTVVADVVAEVLHRALEEGRDPDAIGAERRDVVQSPGDAGQITDAVAVGVLEGARIDLVDHATAPPAVVGCLVAHACGDVISCWNQRALALGVRCWVA